MVIDIDDISQDALDGIIRENILRGADIWQDDTIKSEIEKTKGRIRSGELTILYSQAKNNVTLVDSKLLKK